MTYQATVINVMIATPSDVATERQIIREVLHTWNVVHAVDRRSVLLPLTWETHTAPELGDRPQAIINKRVLHDADLLVAAFWTRLGTPTGRAASGTVEEIEEHLAVGKPAMLYFSSAPVRPDSVDDGQYRALRQFRAEMENRGLVESYDSIANIRDPHAVTRLRAGLFWQDGDRARLERVSGAREVVGAGRVELTYPCPTLAVRKGRERRNGP